MGLVFGENEFQSPSNNPRSGYFEINNEKLIHFNFKVAEHLRNQIHKLIEKKLVYSYSEFIRFSFLNQFIHGFDEFLKDRVSYYNLYGIMKYPKIQMNAKFPEQLAIVIRSFCKNHQIPFSHYLQYSLKEELKRWKNITEVIHVESKY